MKNYVIVNKNNVIISWGKTESETLPDNAVQVSDSFEGCRVGTKLEELNEDKSDLLPLDERVEKGIVKIPDGYVLSEDKTEFVMDWSEGSWRRQECIEEVKEELSKAFKEVTSTAHCMSSLGFEIDANETADRNLSGLITTMSNKSDGSTTLFRDYNNEFQIVNLDGLKTLQTDVITNGQLMYQAKWEMEKMLNDATSEKEFRGIEVTVDSLIALRDKLKESV